MEGRSRGAFKSDLQANLDFSESGNLPQRFEDSDSSSSYMSFHCLRQEIPEVALRKNRTFRVAAQVPMSGVDCKYEQILDRFF